jgi:hypothetical protein
MGYVPVPMSQRVPRRPRHSFQVRQLPWGIQPVAIAPVIAGETMQNALIQTRAVSDPISNPLVGWWLEYFLFYVKLRDIEYTQNLAAPNVPIYPDIEKMLLDPNWDFTTSTLYNAAAQIETYKGAGSIDWVQHCLRRVTETWFRKDGEAWNVGGLRGGVPCTSLWEDEQEGNGAGWWDSAVRSSAVTWDEGINVDLNLDQTITTAEIDQAMRVWQYQLATGQTVMNFNDYLKQFGISVPIDDLHRPELLRFVRQWQYPSNTVDPLTGTPSSALSWSVAERADKDRFFSEPGFLFLCSVFRPKIYYRNQGDAAVQMLTNCFTWMPQLFSAEPQSSWRNFADSAVPKTRGPYGTTPVGGYWVDIKDLYLYGDQFVNQPMGPSPVGDNLNVISNPTTTLGVRFPGTTDHQKFFKDITKCYLHQDGVCNFTILGTQVETSLQGPRYT